MVANVKTLIDAGIFHPGRRVLALKYKSNVVHVDLMNDGKIMWNNKCFNTPSNFSLTYKRLFTPGLASDNGLNSITYKGLPLNTYFERFNDNHGTPPASTVSRDERGTINLNLTLHLPAPS